MWEAIVDAVIYRVPWFVYAGLGLVVVGVIYRLFGWRGALAALAAVVAVFGYQKGAQQGYKDREARGNRETTDALDRATKARNRSRADNAGDGIMRDDGFRRD